MAPYAGEPMSADQFKAALGQLRWTYVEAAHQLGRVGASLDFVERWAAGVDLVPQGAANVVRAALLIQDAASKAPDN